VPRDVEPEVAELSDVYLYTVDDLREVIEENKRLRASEASKADEIIVQGIVELQAELRSRRSSEVVRNYRESAIAIQESELERALKALEKGDDADEIIRRLARNLTNKLIHAPTTGLRRLARDGDDLQVNKAKILLGLDDDFNDVDEQPTLQ